jgi:DnaJ-class molecular chaperone
MTSKTDTPDLYSLLGLSKNATEDDIRKAYKKMAIKHHPDRNPNDKEAANIKFQEINKAYSILSNPDKKRNYDQFGVLDGHEGQMGAGGNNPFDIFANFFGGGMGNRGNFGGEDQRRNSKSPDKNITINLTLADLYNGKTFPLDFNKIIKCDKCDGNGTPNKEHIKSCGVCGGKGKIVRMQQFGPMIQQSVQQCYQCNGVGKTIEKGCECVQCAGKKYVNLKRHLDCYVRAGAAVGSKINFKNEADWSPEFGDVGDLVVFVNCNGDNSNFRREGDNLIMKRSISLLEALTTTQFNFRHLDDRCIKVVYDNIIKPNQKMIIEGEGMPKFSDPMFKGDLIINFDVIFPNYLDKERSKYLAKILPMPKKQIWDLALDSVPEDELVIKEIKPFDNSMDNNQNPNSTNHNVNNPNNPNIQNKFQSSHFDDIDIDDEFNANIPHRMNPVECATQ